MAASVGNRGITEYGINVAVESEDGRLKASSRGSGIAQMNMTVDRGAAGVLNSIRMNPLVICFDAQVPEDLPGTKKCIEMARPVYSVETAKSIPSFAITIDKVPGYPVDLKTELFDINASDVNGTLMVATVTDTGAIVGDVDTLLSKYDPSTGKCEITFMRPLQPGQAITYMKRFTVPSTNPASPLQVKIPGLVPYISIREYGFTLKVFDVKLNQHFPVAPGTVTLTALTPEGSTMKVTDDGAGKLVGNIDPSGKNYIDYNTGEVSVTFAGYLKEGSAIQAEHAAYVEVKEFQKSNTEPVHMKVVLEWEDLARIVKSAEQAANSAEATLKYRANT